MNSAAFERRRRDACRHFNGFRHGRCRADQEYQRAGCVESGWACFGENPGACEWYSRLSDGEFAIKLQRIRNTVTSIQEGKSPCCGAAIDESRVIQQGPLQGHGRRYCTACGRLVYHA
jgi:hypothetical protein